MSEQAPGGQPNDLAAAYFGWHARNELRAQRCDECKRWQHPPLELCPGCGSADLSWQPLEGHGTLVTWTVTHYAFAPALADQVPYVTGVIRTVEGVRLLALVVDVDPAQLGYGLAVSVRFRDVGGRRLAVFTI